MQTSFSFTQWHAMEILSVHFAAGIQASRYAARWVILLVTKSASSLSQWCAAVVSMEIFCKRFRSIQHRTYSFELTQHAVIESIFLGPIFQIVHRTALDFFSGRIGPICGGQASDLDRPESVRARLRRCVRRSLREEACFCRGS